MKTKDLIELLKKTDPSGEAECVINTPEEYNDIYDAEIMEGYWNGAFQKLDIEARPYGQEVVKARIISSGYKVVIRSLPIKDALMENPNLPVEINVGNKEACEMLEKSVEKWREEAKEEN